MGIAMVLVALLFVLVYITIGTIVFRFLEADYEVERQKALMRKLQSFVDQYRCLDQDNLLKVLDFIDRDLDTARHVLRHNDTFNVMWDTTGAASFVISVITTIGYGHITPRTVGGKVTCMLYAIIGIPLLLVFLKGAGEILWKLCCKCLQHSKACTSENRVLQRLNACVHGVLGLTILFVFPCAVNVHLEDWSVLDAIYSCFITLTTIGFGDFVPGNPADRHDIKQSREMRIYRSVNLLWTLMGLAYISMLITAISNYYISKTHGVKMKAQGRMEKLKLRLVQKLNCKVSSCHNSTQTPAESQSVKTSQNLQPLSEDVASDLDVQLVAFSAVPEKPSSGGAAPSSATVVQSLVSPQPGDGQSTRVVASSGVAALSESVLPDRTAQSLEPGALPGVVSQPMEVINDKDESVHL